MLPVYSYDLFSAELLLSFEKMIDTIKANGDTFCVPEEFYTIKDVQGIDFQDVVERVFDENQYENHDEMEFLMNMIYCNNQVDDSYNELLQECQRQDEYRNEYIGFVKDQADVGSPVFKYTATDEESLHKVYRNVADHFTDYLELYAWRTRCYPAILFTNDAFSGSTKIGTYQNNVAEMRKCLVVLNDDASFLYDSMSEEEAISSLQAKSGVKCSGKGVNERSAFKKKVRIKKNGSVEYEISCIPHFKLEEAYSNKRLYFSWGRDEIDNHKIIVVHVGEHWNSGNEKLADIE